jgi:hypothetical protein
MHVEIKSALQLGKALTPTQRKSGFSEAPVLMGKVLRRGVVVKLSPGQVEDNKLAISRLLKSESVLVEVVDGKERIPVLDVSGLLDDKDGEGDDSSEQDNAPPAGNSSSGDSRGEAPAMETAAPTSFSAVLVDETTAVRVPEPVTEKPTKKHGKGK